VTTELTLNKDSFLYRFLLPISKLTDNVSLIPDEKSLYAICSSQDGSVILLATLKTEVALKGFTKINLPDVKKFVRLLECIDSTTLELSLNGNHLCYSTPEFKFNYFLLEESYMQRCPVNPTKIKQLTYDTEFTLVNNKFNDVLKGSSIATDSDKLYFYTKNDQVFAELNDYERQNINNITYLVSDAYTGEPIKNTLPLNLENIRLLAGLKSESIKVKINNELKVTLFEIEDDKTTIKFIVSALVK
jgi:hypothetical protein